MNQNYENYFLGNNTPNGFHSLFPDVYAHRKGWTAYILKGGPGTGKSSLMKRLAASASAQGQRVQLAWCSSDPKSLDSVILPSLKIAVLDGTAPHVLEPELPGVREQIVNLGRGLDNARLKSNEAEIERLTRECSKQHAQATRYLRAAGAFTDANAALIEPLTDMHKLTRAAARLIERCRLGRESSDTVREKRLISAVTMDGITVLPLKFQEHGEVIPVEDERTGLARVLMGCLSDMLGACGEVIVCPCSQKPKSIEHLIFPERELAICSCSHHHRIGSSERSIHCERFLSSPLTRDMRRELLQNERIASQLTLRASACMSRAKEIHDSLEHYYVSAMDFSVVDEIARELENEIL